MSTKERTQGGNDVQHKKDKDKKANLFEARAASRGFLKTSCIMDKFLMYVNSVDNNSCATRVLLSPAEVPVLGEKP